MRGPRATAPHRGRADVRPSGRALRTAVLVVTGIAGLAVLTGDVWLLLLACLAVGALVVDALLPWRGGCLHVGVRLPARARVGDEVPVLVTATNGGTRLSRASVVTVRDAPARGGVCRCRCPPSRRDRRGAPDH